MHRRSPDFNGGDAAACARVGAASEERKADLARASTRSSRAAEVPHDSDARTVRDAVGAVCWEDWRRRLPDSQPGRGRAGPGQAGRGQDAGAMTAAARQRRVGARRRGRSLRGRPARGRRGPHRGDGSPDARAGHASSRREPVEQPCSSPFGGDESSARRALEAACLALQGPFRQKRLGGFSNFRRPVTAVPGRNLRSRNRSLSSRAPFAHQLVPIARPGCARKAPASRRSVFVSRDDHRAALGRFADADARCGREPVHEGVKPLRAAGGLDPDRHGHGRSAR